MYSNRVCNPFYIWNLFLIYKMLFKHTRSRNKIINRVLIMLILDQIRGWECKSEFSDMNSSAGKIQNIKLNLLNSVRRAEFFTENWLLFYRANIFCGIVSTLIPNSINFLFVNPSHIIKFLFVDPSIVSKFYLLTPYNVEILAF